MEPRRRAFRPAVDRLDGRVLPSVNPLSPAQIRRAYGENLNFTVNGNLYTADGGGQTIAIVIGGLDRTIYSDLQAFDRRFGLPDPSFRSVYFQGAQYNTTKDGFIETALDVEWAHAVAPRANILLVQAASMNNQDLMTAVDWARRQPGVSVVSMSWGGAESSSDHYYDSYFTTPAGHTGVTFVAASGDTGAWTDRQRIHVGVSWPAVVQTVLSVGGTSLNAGADGSYLRESAWSGSGGGYSRYYSEPSYQRGVQGTGVRTVPDVAYDADFGYSGVSVYDGNNGGWLIVGGTSAGAPQWAGLIALANQGRAMVGLGPLDGASQTIPSLYRYSRDLHDVSVGSNGYRAAPGYDLATGLGTPSSVSLIGDLAFHAVTSPVTYSTTPSHPAVAANVSSIQVQFNGLDDLTAADRGNESPSAPARPASQGALPAVRGMESSVDARGSAAVAMPPEVLAGRPVRRRLHHLLDEALEALVSEYEFAPAF